jgi:hypothetical protein
MQAEDILKELVIIKTRLGRKTDVFVCICPDGVIDKGFINGAIYPDGAGASKSVVMCWANTWEQLIEDMKAEANKINTKRLALRFTTSIQ